MQIADGVDERTWEYHRDAGDYSNWLRHSIKDDDLAREVAAVETNPALDAQLSRQRIREIISSRYTAPANP